MNRDATARLTEIREQIDSLDEQILGLLNRRSALSREVGQLKSDSLDVVFKPFREKEVMEKLLALSDGCLPEKHLRAIYRKIRRPAYFSPSRRRPPASRCSSRRACRAAADLGRPRLCAAAQRVHAGTPVHVDLWGEPVAARAWDRWAG